MQKPPQLAEARVKTEVLRLLYLSALQARSADAHPPMRTLHDCAHRPQIHVPAPFGDVMGVADIVSKLRPFAAHFAYACHDTNSRIGSDFGGQRPKVLRFFRNLLRRRRMTLQKGRTSKVLILPESAARGKLGKTSESNSLGQIIHEDETN